MMKNNFLILFLFTALVYGVISRGFWLSKSPPSLNWDEASLGYNAYSLMETGRDEYGRFLPLTLRSLNDYKGAVYAYLSIPFIKILGLNQTVVRLPSVLAGIGLIYLAYLLGKKIDSKMTGVWASLAVAMSGWGIIFSRTAFESNLGLLFLILGVYLTIFKEKSKSSLFWGSFWLMMSAYTYHAEKLIAPLMFLWVVGRYWRFGSKRLMLLFAGFLLILGLPLATILIWGGGGVRFKGTSIVGKLWPFRPQQAVFYPLSLPFYFINEVLGRFLAPLSPATLFVRGSVSGAQQLYMAGVYPVSLAAAFIAGIGVLIKFFKQYFSLLALLGIFGLVAGISWDWFRLVRSLPFIFMLSIVIGMGVRFIYERLGKYKSIFILGLFGLVMLEGIYNLNSAWMSVPTYFGGDYQDGMGDLAEKVQKYEADFKRIVIDTNQAQAYIFMLFYGKIDPREYQRQILDLSEEELREHVRFGKYEFRDLYWPEEQKLENTLFVTSPINIGDEKVEQAKDAGARIIDKMYHFGGDETMRFIAID